MKTTHGSGCDGIASVFIKIALPLISGSLRSGKFPNDWKAARVAPFYKNGAIDNCSKYRPIAVLLSLFRGFEKAYNQLYRYLDSIRLIHSLDFGLFIQLLPAVWTAQMTGA